MTKYAVRTVANALAIFACLVIFTCMAGSSHAADSPLRVTLAFSKGLHTITITSTVDSIAVINVSINRGNIKINSAHAPIAGDRFFEDGKSDNFFPQSLKFGEQMLIRLWGKPIEVAIDTNQGSWIYKFNQ